MYMGTKKKGSDKKGNHVVLNDYVLPDALPVIYTQNLPIELERQRKERSRGQHFRIRYSTKQGQFFAKDLGIGLGSFARLHSQATGSEPLVLKDTFLINVATYYILVNLSSPEEARLNKNLFVNPNLPLLNLKVFGGPENATTFTIDPN